MASLDAAPPAAGVGAGVESPPQPVKANETDITAGTTVTILRDFDVMEIDLTKLGIRRTAIVDPSFMREVPFRAA